MWYYVMQNTTSKSIRVVSDRKYCPEPVWECAYTTPRGKQEAERFAKALATSVGSLPPCRNAFPSVNARGSGKACQQSALSKAPSIDNRSLIVHNTDHVPQRRVA